MKDLGGKVAVVTGGGRGIGRAIALALAGAGAEVAVLGRTKSVLDEVVAMAAAEEGGSPARPTRSRAYVLDVRHRPEVATVLGRIGEDFGHIDIVVNNAGVSGHTPIDGDDDSRWDDILATNLTGSMTVTRAALRWMPEGGRIINMSSVLGKFGVPAYGAYCASKTGLLGWTRAVALELAPRKITVNAICPGWVDTEMSVTGVREIAAREGKTPEEARREAESRVPLGRFLDPEEIASLVLYLCSSGARAVTAQAISICAGQTAF